MTTVPIIQGVGFYSDSNKQATRYESVKKSFSQNFGTNPAFFARAPGRVNLIGEHIDYCHFSVLPMAIEVDVIAAVGPVAENRVKIANTDSKFAPVEIPLPGPSEEILVNNQSPSWADYFKCGMIVARKYMKDTGLGDFMAKKGALQGFNALFDGTVPTGGGLSSSAALCIASTLAVLRINGVSSISKADLTEITVVCEHYVGLSNGGMDQSASINGEDGKVLLISFKPKLEAVPFKFPSTNPETVFLITNSLVTANKTETAPANYNLRVVEVAIAADIIAHTFGLDVEKNSNIQTASLRGSFDGYFTQNLGLSSWDGKDIDMGITRLEQILQVVESMYTHSEKEGLTVEQAQKLTGITDEEKFTETYLSHFPVRFTKLDVYRRTIHVYSDSLRVLKTVRAVRSFSGDSEKFLLEVGDLMNTSQTSTRDYNQASTELCDELCLLGRENGSYGSRVTGAGFGGCVVHLTTVEKLPMLVSALKKKYYSARFPGMQASDLDDAIVVSKPAMGACIVEM